MKIINKYGHYIMPFYMPAEFIVKKAKGSHVWDTDGKKFIDLTAGIAVTSLGHSNSELNNIVSKQTKSLWHLSNLYINEPSVRLASKLCKNTFGDKVFFSNSGAEAIEAAVKTARKYSTKKFHSKKNEIVSFTTSFHGRTLMGITLAHSKALDNGFGPLPKGIKSHKYNSTQGLDKVISNNTSAILLEVVQWQSGITSANIKFIAELKKLAKKHNALIIIDEVQSGIGRTGSLFAYEQFKIKPDIVCFAKGIANGLPLGGIITTDEVSSFMTPGLHGSTFGGNPIACAVGEKVIDIISKKSFLNRVKKKEKLFLGLLKDINNNLNIFSEVKSKGLWLSVTFLEDSNIMVDELITKCHQNGLMILKANIDTVRFSPSLIIEDMLIEESMQIFEKTLTQIQNL